MFATLVRKQKLGGGGMFYNDGTMLVGKFGYKNQILIQYDHWKNLQCLTEITVTN